VSKKINQKMLFIILQMIFSLALHNATKIQNSSILLKSKHLWPKSVQKPIRVMIAV